MKVKILTWAKDGNSLTYKSREIFPLSNLEDVFITNLYSSFKYPDDESLKMIVYKFGDLFLSSENAREHIILNNIDKIKEHKNCYLELIPQKSWINLLDIEIFKLLGLDYKSLEGKRCSIIEERKKKEEALRLEREKQAKEDELKKKAFLESEFIKFKAGEKVDKFVFMELCSIKGVELHIRTKGLLNRLKEANISISQAYISGVNAKRVNLDKIFEAANLLYKCL